MHLSVNVEKTHLAFFLTGIIIVMGIGFATADVQQNRPWHSADQIEITLDGIPTDLQSALDSVATTPLGGRVLFSEHAQANPSSSQGDTSNPRYVSFDVTDIVKNNCQANEGDERVSECFLIVELFRTDTYSETMSFRYKLIYFPEGYYGNTKEALLLQTTFNAWDRINLNNGAADGCTWRGGDRYTYCEKCASSDGTWNVGSQDGKIYLSIDRQYNSAWNYVLKIIQYQ